jgi:hypothetical protein
MFVHARKPGVFKATMVPLRPEASDGRYIEGFRTRALQLWQDAKAAPAAVKVAMPTPLAPAAT